MAALRKQLRLPNRKTTHQRALKLLAHIPTVDGRSHIARRYRNITEALLSDYNDDQMTESRKQLVARFAACAALSEQYEKKLANNEQIDVPEYALVVSTMLRITSQIGVNRTAKVINTPTLSQYLTREAAE